MVECVWAMVEWYWQENTEALEEKYFSAGVLHGWMGVEEWRYITDSGKVKPWKRKKLYSMVGSRLNGCGAMVQ